MLISTPNVEGGGGTWAHGLPLVASLLTLPASHFSKEEGTCVYMEFSESLLIFHAETTRGRLLLFPSAQPELGFPGTPISRSSWGHGAPICYNTSKEPRAQEKSSTQEKCILAPSFTGFVG